ncbi:MAG: DegV family protein [Anaerolineaceae bacterium]|nr:DegV family protein [Anaerolineaceae bacterium]
MSKVMVVTDSTATIPADLARDLPLVSLPLNLIWGDEVLLDGVDIQPEAFYTRLASDKVTPTTSQPTPEAFKAVYSRLLKEGYDILSIHISSKLSGTLDSATLAKATLEAGNIELFDSLATSMALGFQALAAARAAKEGATLQECAALADQARAHTNIYFAVSTLEFLRRGGRIGGAAAFLGTALNLKPILTLRDGRVEAIERVRTSSKAVDRLVELVMKDLEGKRPIHLATLHANAPKGGQALMEKVRAKLNPSDISEAIFGEVCPVLGTHTGPGTVGLAYLAGM